MLGSGRCSQKAPTGSRDLAGAPFPGRGCSRRTCGCRGCASCSVSITGLQHVNPVACTHVRSGPGGVRRDWRSSGKRGFRGLQRCAWPRAGAEAWSRVLATILCGRFSVHCVGLPANSGNAPLSRDSPGFGREEDHGDGRVRVPPRAVATDGGMRAGNGDTGFCGCEQGRRKITVT